MGTLYLGGQRVLPVLKVGEGGTSRNIGEIVASTIPLTDAGLHLLDGDVINGDGVYSAFTEYIASSYDSSSKIVNATKSGSLTDDDCVLSGFSESNYATLPATFSPQLDDTWEINVKVATNNDTIGSYKSGHILSGVYSTTDRSFRMLINSSGHFQVSLSSGGSTWDIAELVSGTYTIQPNTDYWVKMTFDKNFYKLYYSTDGNNFIEDISIESSSTLASFLPYMGYYLGASSTSEYDYAFHGSIDLKGCYIDINEQRWWTGANPSWATDESQWQSSITTYGVCGKFVYDSVNNTVRLPKYSNKIFTQELDSTAPVVGNGKSLGLTNGTTEYGLGFWGADSGNYRALRPQTGNVGLDVGVATAGSYPANNIVFGVTQNASNSNIIADLSDITTSLDGYYYIVIATSTKTDIQVDIDEVVTDLNGKVDKSSLSTVHCVVETYQNGTSWYRIYDDGWCEQGGTNTNDGNIIVTLLKPYRDTNYSVIATPASSNNQNPNYSAAIGTRTTTQFNISFSNNTTGNSCNHWRAYGYIN